ncbi:hypothetical protein [Phaeobacter gallaeciensis]|uniref:Uncharacterized protein n=1 Tax=Phaeobacter gallaeciensis TaxID=60890 RepID=A0AAC9ZA07_9RHOB|nr:hypothetical protein [Phaeobacter gallaeciensis]AHD10000.1 hypothetical protein Gal_02253 [Phaeobacter gallaeciensis DSM 26640]ATE93264.1 hypothetical protein PhaeoP11_02244 [Phaeobacter gallaeciensis]ATE96915.1 hypothetical protein PhaeoP73_01603 [Phaeobacter gallaeciensis]ATF01928.1 hypothetical protein PhaeoP75_02293 [Phaeobacter gallaeciensis]ATF06308.1 hypothetical protein PhaeoP63_02242 [Phaeobacter gallaeciensis]
MANYEQLMDAARRADGAGDTHAAKRFLQLAKEQKTPKGVGQVIKENLLGDDDPTTQNFGEKVGTFLNNAGESLTLGLVGDEAAAATDAALGRGGYDERLQHYRGQQEQFAKENRASSIVSELAPAAIPGLGAFSALRTGSGVLRAAKAGGVAAVSGGVYGFMEGEGDFTSRRKNAVEGAKWSGAFGVGVPLVGRMMGTVARRAMRGRKVREMVKSAPSLEELRTKASAIFERADAQANLDRRALTKAAPAMQDRAIRQGMDDVLTPQASRANDRIMDAATDPRAEMGFRDLDILRRQAQVPAGNASNRVEAAIGSQMVEGLDDVLRQAAPDTASEVDLARRMWGQLRRTELIDDAVYRAQNAASGFENGIRVQVRRILNNPKQRRLFGDEEVKAMEAVVQGTSASNALKKAGKFGVGQGAQSNGLMAMLALKEFGIAAPVIGTAVQRLGERATVKNAEIARALVASGAQIQDPLLEAARRHAIDDLLTKMAGRGGEAVSSLSPNEP